MTIRFDPIHDYSCLINLTKYVRTLPQLKLRDYGVLINRVGNIQRIYWVKVELPGLRWISFRITQGIGIEEIEYVWEQLPLA